MNIIEFKDKNGTFAIKNPENYSGLYLPLAGEKGLKSSITPNLGGDSKTDQNHFLFEPVSIENLHNNKNSRNFWLKIEGKCNWSVAGVSAEQELNKFTAKQDESELEAGFMWQKLTRISNEYGIKSETTSFVTIDGDIEVTLIEFTNISDEILEITPIAAFPIYGRSADNIRDHRHVTSLLHRISVINEGVVVTPVLSFDERGHLKNNISYFVCGFTGDGSVPKEFYAAAEDFIGEGGSFLNPEAVRTDKPGMRAKDKVDGKEAFGGLKFEKISLGKNKSASYIVLSGIADKGKKIEDIVSQYKTKEMVDRALAGIKKYWTEKVNISFHTGDDRTDNYMKWVCFQPILRRIYGCSFLPYHDYGKGGRGWRDLWQDCLALLIMDPSVVRQMILNNYCGVRIDGTNATIIGNKQNDFVADRNNITRIWMDHAFWPFVTTKFYIDQTGDIDILFSKIPYFKDFQIKRGTEHDFKWEIKDGNNLKTSTGEIYFGTVLEHILLQNLCAFYDVGEHNQMKLHGADWNDALDMADKRGESVAFTCAYAGNLKSIADCLRMIYKESRYSKIELAEEMMILFASGKELYDNVKLKQELLNKYTESCKHSVSGHKIIIDLNDVCNNLEEKADWLMENIRANEWIKDYDGGGWFNGYYDNSGKKVELCEENNVRMMLVSQTFAIMSGTAENEHIEAICKSADKYLYSKEIGGYRLNTNFNEEKFDLGRMFGFAYGEKENGAVFSHMAVMYGYALYKRGYAKEGYKALKSLMDTATDFKKSKIYPGLPEYFNNHGRGLYTYLTGAASWYMLTMITEAFGVKGELGNLVISPSLMPEQFDCNGEACVMMEFAGKKFDIHFYSSGETEFGKNKILEAKCDGIDLKFESNYKVKLSKEQIQKLPAKERHTIRIKIKMLK